MLPLRVSSNATAEALNIVKRVLQNKGPTATQDLFKAAITEPSAVPTPTYNDSRWAKGAIPAPPHPEHAVRSMRYLKQVVLPHLERRGDVEKVHFRRTLTQEEVDRRLQNLTKAARQRSNLSTSTVQDVWVWQIGTPKQQQPPKPEPEVFGKEVGVGEDWSHLNKRRRRAREAKVQRDLKWVRQLERVRTQAAQAESAQPLEN